MIDFSANINGIDAKKATAPQAKFATDKDCSSKTNVLINEINKTYTPHVMVNAPTTLPGKSSILLDADENAFKNIDLSNCREINILAPAKNLRQKAYNFLYKLTVAEESNRLVASLCEVKTLKMTPEEKNEKKASQTANRIPSIMLVLPDLLFFFTFAPPFRLIVKK
jgi:hypothetical protein